VQLVTELKHDSGLIFEGTEMRTKYATSLDSIRALLISAGMDPIPKAELSRRCRRNLPIDEFNALLEVLHEIGAVQRFIDKQQERGKPAEYYRGTSILLARTLGEQVLEKFI
jgi:hypothetical protein